MAGFPVVIDDGSTVLMVGKEPMEGGVNSFLLIDAEDNVYATDRVTGITAASEETYPDLSGTTSGITAVPREYDSVQTAAIEQPSGVLTSQVALENTVAPSIAGTAQVGQTLTATPGTYTGDPTITKTGQWEQADAAIGTGRVNIVGEDDLTLVVPIGALGKYITYAETASEGSEDDETLLTRSAATAIVIAA